MEFIAKVINTNTSCISLGLNTLDPQAVIIKKTTVKDVYFTNKLDNLKYMISVQVFNPDGNLIISDESPKKILTDDAVILDNLKSKNIECELDIKLTEKTPNRLNSIKTVIPSQTYVFKDNQNFIYLAAGSVDKLKTEELISIVNCLGLFKEKEIIDYMKVNNIKRDNKSVAKKFPYIAKVERELLCWYIEHENQINIKSQLETSADDNDSGYLITAPHLEENNELQSLPKEEINHNMSQEVTDINMIYQKDTDLTQPRSNEKPIMNESQKVTQIYEPSTEDIANAIETLASAIVNNDETIFEYTNDLIKFTEFVIALNNNSTSLTYENVYHSLTDLYGELGITNLYIASKRFYETIDSNISPLSLMILYLPYYLVDISDNKYVTEINKVIKKHIKHISKSLIELLRSEPSINEIFYNAIEIRKSKFSSEDEMIKIVAFLMMLNNGNKVTTRKRVDFLLREFSNNKQDYISKMKETIKGDYSNKEIIIKYIDVKFPNLNIKKLTNKDIEKLFNISSSSITKIQELNNKMYQLQIQARIANENKEYDKSNRIINEVETLKKELNEIKEKRQNMKFTSGVDLQEQLRIQSELIDSKKASNLLEPIYSSSDKKVIDMKNMSNPDNVMFRHEYDNIELIIKQNAILQINMKELDEPYNYIIKTNKCLHYDIAKELLWNDLIEEEDALRIKESVLDFEQKLINDLEIHISLGIDMNNLLEELNRLPLNLYKYIVISYCFEVLKKDNPSNLSKLLTANGLVSWIEEYK